jgi:hypothetical protein
MKTWSAIVIAGYDVIDDLGDAVVQEESGGRNAPWVLLQMSSKSRCGGRKQPGPMPNGYSKLRLPQLFLQPAREGRLLLFPARLPCAVAVSSNSSASKLRSLVFITVSEGKWCIEGRLADLASSVGSLAYIYMCNITLLNGITVSCSNFYTELHVPSLLWRKKKHHQCTINAVSFSELGFVRQGTPLNCSVPPTTGWNAVPQGWH